MRNLLILSLLFLLGACAADVTGSVKAAALCDVVFQRHSASQEQVVRAGNPTQPVLDLYLHAVELDRQAWRTCYAMLQASLASAGGLTAAQIDQATKAAVELIQAVKK